VKSFIHHFCSLFKGEKAAANIYFRLCKQDELRSSSAWIAMSTDALMLFWKELKSKEVVEIVDGIDDMEWGYRRFSNKDCDGNLLTFSRFLKSEEEDDIKSS
jgi:hypothetical protein